MAKTLHPGDVITTHLGLNMAVGSDRGSPWAKVEVSNTTTVRPGESYTHAKKRSSKDARKRLDEEFNWVLRELGVLKGKRK